MEDREIGAYVTFSFLKKLIASMEQADLSDDAKISFEYIVASCFPDTREKLKDLLTECYIEGYNLGFQDGSIKKGN